MRKLGWMGDKRCGGWFRLIALHVRLYLNRMQYLVDSQWCQIIEHVQPAHNATSAVLNTLGSTDICLFVLSSKELQ